ncbi:thioeseterase [Salipiger pallidus]|uniref:Thioeseterase n=1 Tax=Salipiger pallidus TaxID=1775170 RepID=A0A8J3EFT0_9RHOB|nr:acyl-CoA thioesterase [Salipiger pallidus]GGG72099.1 thioeseterase [Salipiger pallidus]
MYPFIRMAKEIWKYRNAPALGLHDVHVSRHTCWPWDIDLWMELNNGRTLTLFDLGRVPLGRRAGLIGTLRHRRWGLTVAGSVVRYRRRIRPFETIEMRSRMLGWDRRFLYIEQTMWKRGGECANQLVLRAAVTGPGGIVPPRDVLEAMGHDITPPDLPDWVSTWITAEDARPWPPER